jgi:hypothetical protein
MLLHFMKVRCASKIRQQTRSACRIAAVHEERVTDHKACTRAAEPQNGGGNLLRLAETPDSLTPQHTAGKPLRHRRIDHARVDPLARMPLVTYSRAAVSVRPITPCLEAI